MHNRTFLILVFTLLLTYPVLPSTMISHPSITEISAQRTYQELGFNQTNFLDLIVHQLESYATWEEDEFLGWPLSVDGSDDEYYERSYRTGLTGIGDFFLDLLDINHTIPMRLLEVINNHLLSSYDLSDGELSWTRFTNINAEAWTSFRYGSAGIMSFLARSSQYFEFEKLTQIFSSSIKWLNSLQLDTGDYPMVENSYVTTDLEYGATGIAEGLINVYQWTGNSTYLDLANEIGIWLVNRGSWKNGQFKLPWTTYGENSNFEGTTYAGLATGMAGTLNLFLRLYDLTQNDLYRETSKGAGQYLISREHNGTWEESAVDYVTKIGANSGLIGYLVGSSGIALSLLDLYDITTNVTILETTDRVEHHISNLLEADGSIPISKERSNDKYTGLSMGAAGIAYYFTQLFKRSEKTEYLNSAISILNYLFWLLVDNDLIPYDENNEDRGFAFNLDHGLAGIGRSVVEFIKFAPQAVFQSISSYQPSDSFRLFDNPLQNLIITGSLLVFSGLILTYQKFVRKSKD